MSDTLWHLQFSPLTVEHVSQILAWQYEPPYDIYNMGTGVSDPNELAEAIEYFLQPDYHFQAVLRQPAAELVAFCSFGPDGQVGGGNYSVEAIDIGMGVRPDLTGRGLGEMFVGVAIDYAQKQFATSRLRVTIAKFNHRAQKVWQRHGFVPVQQFRSDFGERPFIIYVRNA
jgi:RimJ/RimL family protein N-acetyltransferase